MFEKFFRWQTIYIRPYLPGWQKKKKKKNEIRFSLPFVNVHVGVREFTSLYYQMAASSERKV